MYTFKNGVKERSVLQNLSGWKALVWLKNYYPEESMMKLKYSKKLGPNAY